MAKKLAGILIFGIFAAILFLHFGCGGATTVTTTTSAIESTTSSSSSSTSSSTTTTTSTTTTIPEPPILSNPIYLSSEVTRLGSLYNQPGASAGDPHCGIDIVFIDGGRVMASQDGIVTMVLDWHDSIGPTKIVTIQHNSIYSTIYIFESCKTISVSENDTIRKGEIIGTVGSRETPTLHFAVSTQEGTQQNNMYNDPMEYLDTAGRALLRAFYQLHTQEGLVDPCYLHSSANGYPTGCPSLFGYP